MVEESILNKHITLTKELILDIEDRFKAVANILGVENLEEILEKEPTCLKDSPKELAAARRIAEVFIIKKRSTLTHYDILLSCAEKLAKGELSKDQVNIVAFASFNEFKLLDEQSNELIENDEFFLRAFDPDIKSIEKIETPTSSRPKRKCRKPKRLIDEM